MKSEKTQFEIEAEMASKALKLLRMRYPRKNSE